MKTNELTGAALDWAVAKIERGGDPIYRFAPEPGDKDYEEGKDYSDYFYISGPQRMGPYSPSMKWAEGGPIIERELITVRHIGRSIEGPIWDASISEGGEVEGPTPLIAAMRCYVASKLGDEITLPPELQG